MFVIGGIAGIVFITRPTSVSPSGTIRDLGFCIATAVFIARAYDDFHVTYVEVIGKLRTKTDI